MNRSCLLNGLIDEWLINKASKDFERLLGLTGICSLKKPVNLQ